jgi:SNF2 domain-containing protein/helicase-like protein
MIMGRHALQRLYLAEDLVRRRRADEYRRQVASQRAARIDPNPHQIDAVIFALERIPDGGCILADEVGLGKTIEAGLVIAQLMAEGAKRVLVVTPKALLGQWKQELYALFGIDAREATRDAVSFAGEGVFLATRDLVGSDAGAAAVSASERFDLCVVDEAHEVFASIYKRFDRGGSIREDSPHARIAGRLSTVIAGTPMLLLTATPLQNSLLELWGLVHYVDPTGTLLGDLSTFRNLFCPTDDRILLEGQEHELQRRLGTVLQRTLRRQAQDFMREPFMGRQTQLFEYSMSPEERALYDDVTMYLLEPSLYAFRGKHRKLLLLGFHRRMASSLRALAASLEKVAERLRALRDRRAPDGAADADVILGDLEDDEADEAASDDAPDVREDERLAIAAELARVESFIQRARALPTDSKANALLRAIRLIAEQAEHGKSSGKVVVFTESLTTQDYIRELLLADGVVGDGDITLFRGDNDTPRAAIARDRWFEEVGRHLPPESRPSPDVAIRLALVHEFRTRPHGIFISTEAGAKGLNLQFCDTVINYDLPWNPQRIEQRIGRCHRYGQRRDVTVINFLARDNEAQKLTFDILSQKLDLFGTVLGATDAVLHRPGTLAPETLASGLGAEFETQLRRIYERARTLEEVERELRELRDSMEARRREFETALKRTEDVIQRRFDASVRATFRRIQAEFPRELAEFDRHLERVVTEYLDAVSAPYRMTRQDGGALLKLEDPSRLPAALQDVAGCAIGSSPPGSPYGSLHLRHPLVVAALDHARASIRRTGSSVRVRVAEADDDLRGRRGRMRLIRVLHRNIEITEHLVPVVLLEGDDAPLSADVAGRILDAEIEDLPAPVGCSVAPEELDDAVDELLFHDTSEASRLEQPRFERTLEQIERFITDRVLLLERARDAAVARLAKAQDARDGAIGAEQRNAAERTMRKLQTEIDSLDDTLRTLRAGDDERYRKWRRHTEQRRYTPPEIEHIFDAELEIT